jgi:glycosyltransferase involved in cell wall biosynthesis
MKKKILFIHHGKDIGGAALSLLFLIEKIRPYYDVKVIFVFNSSVIALFKNKNIECETLTKSHPLFIHSAAGGASLLQIKKLAQMIAGWLYFALVYSRRILREESPDIVHLNSTFLTEWAYAAKKNGMPVIVHVREPLGEGHWGFRKNLIRKILKNSATKIIAISRDNAARINLPELTSVSYNFVDFAVFDPDLFKKENIGKKRIAYVGGQADFKGFNWLVDTLKYLDERIEVQFAGYYSKSKMDLKTKIKMIVSARKRRTIRNLNMMRSSSNAREVGLIEDMPKYLSQCDLLVFPSTKPHFARPVIEANAMRIPVIVSSLPGNEEIVEEGINGFLVEVNDPIALAEKINFLCRSGASLKEMGENGYRMAKSKYDSKKNVSEILSVYQEILNR